MKKVFLVLMALAVMLAAGASGDEGKTPCEINGHEKVVDPAVEPTCTKTGLTEGAHCSVCGKVLVKQESVPALDHLFIAWYPNGRGTHIMVCKRKCGYQDVQHCKMMELPLGDPEAEPVSFCPICGTCEGTENMTAVKGLKILSGAPRGSLRVFTLELEGKKYMTVAFEKNGELLQPAGEVSFSLPEEMKDTLFATVDAEGAEQPVEMTSADNVRTLNLNFAQENKDPEQVLVLSVLN